MIIKSLDYDGQTYFNLFESDAAAFGIPVAVVSDAVQKQSLDDAIEFRRLAYSAESDPLYMEWQYDNTPESEQAWRNKVAEIKARYPLPSAS
ncbi:MAG: hypothetical protein SNF94_05430 [Rikenellaceae bacterium]